MQTGWFSGTCLRKSSFERIERRSGSRERERERLLVATSRHVVSSSRNNTLFRFTLAPFLSLVRIVSTFREKRSLAESRVSSIYFSPHRTPPARRHRVHIHIRQQIRMVPSDSILNRRRVDAWVPLAGRNETRRDETRRDEPSGEPIRPSVCHGVVYNSRGRKQSAQRTLHRRAGKLPPLCVRVRVFSLPSPARGG